MSDSPDRRSNWARIFFVGMLGFASAFLGQAWLSTKDATWPALVNLVSNPTPPTPESEDRMMVEPIRDVAAVATEPANPNREPESSSSSSHDPILGVLREKCGTCHSGPEMEPTGFDISDATTFASIVRAGYPDDSSLFQRVAASQDDPMPPADSGIEPLTESEITQLRSWIESQRSDRRRVRLQEELAQVVEDRESMPERGSDVLYVSLRHLHNRSDVTDEQLELYRFAFVKLINSLHWQPRLIAPVAVDDQRLLYRLSTDDLGWDEIAVRSLIDRYPYRVIPSDQTDAVTRRAARVTLRLDWLVNQLSTPAIYHHFLMDAAEVRDQGDEVNPFGTLPGLLKFLHADYDRRFASGKIDRVYIDKGKGTRGSEVSDNYRVLDRLEAITGIVWISHDFQFNDGVQDIKRRPWGPRSKTRDDASSFHQNGGEVIFELPNGLHGYYIADADGNRVETAPVTIVREPSLPHSPTGRPDISTGVACFRCHAGGYRQRATIIPDLSIAGLADGERPRVMNDAKFREQVQRDNVHYRQTLMSVRELIGVSLPPTDSREPISEVVRLYRQPLHAMALASELEQTDTDSDHIAILKAIQATLIGDSGLLELGQRAGDDSRGVADQIDEVIQDFTVSDNVPREVFESVFSHLLFQFQLMEPS